MRKRNEPTTSVRIGFLGENTGSCLGHKQRGVCDEYW